MAVIKKQQNKKLIKNEGFSLIEMLVAIFISILVMTATIQVFSNMIKGYRKAKIIQKDLEEAQFALNITAKSLRAGVLVKCDNNACASAGNYSSLRIFDFSQNKCIEYAVTGTQLTQRSAEYLALADPKPNQLVWCGGSPSFGAVANLATDINAGTFYVVPSNATVAGRITISLKICPNAVCTGGINDEADIQTTVSTRVYTEVTP